jgi:peptidoglycan hydrolase-like protein with peptidoglycan-binding domain
MVAAAAADGVKLGASDSYRPYDVQLSEFKRRYSTSPISGTSTKSWEGRTYWLKRNEAMAATPGTSNHGWGIALDLAQGDGNPAIPKTMWLNWKSLTWLAANGPKFGFWNSVKSEAWHWAYFPGDDIPSAVLEMERTGKVTTSTVPGPAPAPVNFDPNVLRAVPFAGEVVLESPNTMAVAAVQWALTRAGIATTIDGDFGKKTKESVEAFQRANGLEVDGRAGKNTWRALGLPVPGEAPAKATAPVAAPAPAKKAAAKKAAAKKAAAKKVPAKKAAAKKAAAGRAVDGSAYTLTADDADGIIAIVGRSTGLTAAPWSLRSETATAVCAHNGATLDDVWHPGDVLKFPSSIDGVRTHTVTAGETLADVTRALGLGDDAQAMVAAINSWQGAAPQAGQTWFGGPDA